MNWRLAQWVSGWVPFLRLWADLTVRILFWVGISVLIACLFSRCPSWVPVDEPNKTAFQILVGAFIGYVAYARARRSEVERRIYFDVVKVLDESVDVLHDDPASFIDWDYDLFFVRRLVPKPDIMAKASAFRIKHFEAMLKAIGRAMHVVEAHEHAFRFFVPVFRRLRSTHMRLLNLGSQVLNELNVLQGDVENREAWEAARKTAMRYRECKHDAQMYCVDLKHQLANRVLGDVYGVVVPDRMPTRRRYRVFRPNYFPAKSIFRRPYDFASRFLWWV